MESFFRKRETELVHHRPYTTRDETRRDLFAYVEGFYNREQLRLGCVCKTPAAVERRAQRVA